MTFRNSDIISRSEAETRDAGRALAASLPAGALVAISGDLGSGKTALVRGMCEHEKCDDQVTSPTFTIVNEYEGTRRVVHIDLYRLSSIQDMLEIGLDEVFRSEGLILVEWAERALPILPAPRYEIAARHGSEEHIREYSIRFFEDGCESILTAPAELLGRTS